MPIPTPSEIISSRLERLDGQLLQAIDNLSEDEASRWLAETAPSCKWHLWHMARWADYVQSLLSDVVDEHSPELWEFTGVADEWGFEGVDLGMWGAGSGLGNETGKYVRGSCNLVCFSDKGSTLLKQPERIVLNNNKLNNDFTSIIPISFLK